MGNFEERLRLASLLEKTFIEAFNKYFGDRFIIVKYGIETTELHAFHNYLRTCHDITSHFVRYIPDSVLIETKRDENHRLCPTRLIEFKAAKTGLYSPKFFEKLKGACPSVPLERKEDVFNIEKDALDLYKALEEKLNIPVVIIAYAAYRSDTRLFAQYSSEIGICNEYNPNKRGKNRGSGTVLYNVSLKTFQPLKLFLKEDLLFSDDEIERFLAELEARLSGEL